MGELEVDCFIRHLNPQSVNVTSELEALHFQGSAAGRVEWMFKGETMLYQVLMNVMCGPT